MPEGSLFFQLGDVTGVVSGIEVSKLQVNMRGNEVGFCSFELCQDRQGLIVTSGAPQQFPLVGENR